MKDTGLYTVDGRRIMREAEEDESLAQEEVSYDDGEINQLIMEEQKLLGKLNKLLAGGQMSRGDLHQGIEVLGHLIGLYREFVARAAMDAQNAVGGLMNAEFNVFQLGVQIATVDKLLQDKGIYNSEERGEAAKLVAQEFKDRMEQQRKEEMAQTSCACEENTYSTCDCGGECSGSDDNVVEMFPTKEVDPLEDDTEPTDPA